MHNAELLVYVQEDEEEDNIAGKVSAPDLNLRSCAERMVRRGYSNGVGSECRQFPKIFAVKAENESMARHRGTSGMIVALTVS